MFDKDKPLFEPIAEIFLLSRRRMPKLSDEMIGLKWDFPVPGQGVLGVKNLFELDLILRCLEDELSVLMSEDKNMNSSLDIVLQGLICLTYFWVLGAYEILRSANERTGRSLRENDLFRDLTALRVSLAKYQIARDRKLKNPLAFAPDRGVAKADDISSYDPKDPERSYSSFPDISDRGSPFWRVVHVQPNVSEVFLERRDLSDRFVEFSRGLKQGQRDSPSRWAEE